MNLLFVPRLAHAGLALSIGLGAMVNATLLLVGLIRRGAYQPSNGWGRFLLQVLAASALMAVFLLWSAAAVPWTAFEGERLLRVGLLAATVAGAAALYFAVLALSGLPLRQFIRK
jgi:putative peptidoglycan lipid II flippase